MAQTKLDYNIELSDVDKNSSPVLEEPCPACLSNTLFAYYHYYSSPSLEDPHGCGTWVACCGKCDFND